MTPIQSKTAAMKAGAKQCMQNNLLLVLVMSILPLCRSACVNIKRHHSSWELYRSKCHGIMIFQLLYVKNLNLLFLEKLVKSDHTRPAYFEYFVIHAVSNCAWKLFGTVQAKMILGTIIAI